MTIEDVARKENLTKISKVNLVIGKMRQIVPDVFTYAFSIAGKGTLAQEAVLQIDFVTIEMICSACNKQFQIEEHNYFCPDCGGTKLQLINGKELYIESIVGE